MIVDLLAYGLLIGTLLAGSAWLLEGALRLHAKSLGWIWVAALLATAALVVSGPLHQSPRKAASDRPAARAPFEIPRHADAVPPLAARLDGFFAAAVAVYL